MNQTFRTIVQPRRSEVTIRHDTGVFLVGSCFTEEIGGKLKEYKFPVLINPAGIQYNPASIAEVLKLIVSGSAYRKGDLEQAGGKWFSWLHHGRFSSSNRQKCLDTINGALDGAREFLQTATVVCMTFGTAWYYRLKQDGKVVSNCHKQPDTLFTRQLMGLEEIKSAITGASNAVNDLNPDARFIFTVSPVRHLKDGFAGNSRSKALLISGVHELCNTLPAEYFPAYEIMMDDLRDYRFYASDMTHPAEAAVDYIWDRFSSAYMSETTKQICTDLEPLRAAIKHRPIDTETGAHGDFCTAMLKKIDVLAERYPLLDFSEERSYFSDPDNFIHF